MSPVRSVTDVSGRSINDLTKVFEGLELIKCNSG
jgi:hypothetical protein